MWFLAVAFLAVLATANAAAKCPCKEYCPLNDDGFDIYCFDRNLMWGMIEPQAVYNQIKYVNKTDGSAGGWGALVYASNDLSQLTVSMLRNQGLDEAVIDQLRPFLTSSARGFAVKALVDQYGFKLKADDSFKVRNAWRKLKLKSVEAYWNIEVNRAGAGTCFINLPSDVRALIITASSWGVRGVRRDLIRKAFGGDLQGVVNVIPTVTDGLYYRNLGNPQNWINRNDKSVRCPVQATP